MAEPLVAILLSTYNGERFLSEQLDSLLAQTHRNTRIVVRDDGSSDGTRAMLERYRQAHTNIQITYGENLGSIASFFWLIDHAPQDAAYFCFCDQDDVWEADKITRGVRALDGLDRLQQQRRKVCIVFFEVADVSGAIAIAAPFRGALAAPIQAQDFKAARSKFVGDLVVLFEEFRVPVQHQADCPLWHGRGQFPDAGAQMALVRRHQSERAKGRHDES